MPNSFLTPLAKEILFHLQTPISKVKFAKVIYFVFKNLLLQEEVDSSSLAFIRMPLGPVPDGFMELENDPDICTTEEGVGLVYNRKNYSLADEVQIDTSLFTTKIKDISLELNTYPTSMLVSMSHDEPSWIHSSNGDKFFISAEDLAIPLPVSNRARALPQGIDEQLIQSSLLSGMKKEVVADSTSLEHPEAYL